MLSGYLYGPRSVNAARAGVLTGFVGGIPIVLWNSWTAFTNFWENPIVTDTIGDSAMMAVVSVGAVFFTVAVMPVVLLVVGWIGGVIGGWMSERIDSARLFGSKS